MADGREAVVHRVLDQHQADLLKGWVAALSAGSGFRSRMTDAEVHVQCRNVLGALRDGTAESTDADIHGDSFSRLREILSELSSSRAAQGFTPSETAGF